MLVLSRKLHEIIVVGDHLLVTHMGYAPRSGLYTFTIADERDERDGRIVQMQVEDAVEVTNGVAMKLIKGRGTKVSLGFTAPANVHIDRLEVRQK